MSYGVNRTLVADTTNDEAIFRSLSASAAMDALYDSQLWDPQETRECLEGTRRSIFGQIELALGARSNTIIWLSGSPGTGKSAIAHTVARSLETQSRLAGTFFFSSKHKHLSGMAGLGVFVSTLAYQFAKSKPIAKDFVFDAIRSDPAILDPMKPLAAQFKNLLVSPLGCMLVGSSESKVVIIDAIDACEERRIFELVSCLSNLLRESRIPNLHIFITSRRPLDAAVKKAIGGVVSAHPIVLDDADFAEVHEEICLLFKHALDRSYRNHNVEYPEPILADKTIRCLAKRANGRFGTASTMMRFLDTNDVLCTFDDKLDMIKDPGDRYLSPTKIFCFYEFIINSSENPSRTYKYLSIVVNLAEPLAPIQLQKLLGSSESDLLPILISSSPIVSVPADDSRAVEVLHKESLRAFLSQHSSQHLSHAFQLLAYSSLRMMKGAFQRQSDLKSILERMRMQIPIEVELQSEIVLLNFLESYLEQPCNMAIREAEWYNEYNKQSKACPPHVAPSRGRRVVNGACPRSGSGAYRSTASRVRPCNESEDVPKALLAVKKFRASSKFHDLDVFELLTTMRTLPKVLFILILLGVRHAHPSASHDINSMNDSSISHVSPAFNDFMRYLWDGSEKSMKSPTALKHACRYWCFYLSHAPTVMDESLRTFLSAFWQDKLLSWFEQQWRLGGLESCIDILCTAQDIEFNEKPDTPRAMRWINNVISRMSSEIRS